MQRLVGATRVSVGVTVSRIKLPFIKPERIILNQYDIFKRGAYSVLSWSVHRPTLGEMVDCCSASQDMHPRSMTFWGQFKVGSINASPATEGADRRQQDSPRMIGFLQLVSHWQACLHWVREYEVAARG